MKSFVSNDNNPTQSPGQGSVRITLEPTCHSLVVRAEASWEAIEHLSNMFVGLGDLQQIFEFKRNDDVQRDQRRADNDNIAEARKAENLKLGKEYSEALIALCENRRYSRHEALAQIAMSYGKAIHDVEVFIKLYNREQKAERKAQIKVLMAAGKSVREAAKVVGVSPATAGRIMKSLKETGDV